MPSLSLSLLHPFSLLTMIYQMELKQHFLLCLGSENSFTITRKKICVFFSYVHAESLLVQNSECMYITRLNLLLIFRVHAYELLGFLLPDPFSCKVLFFSFLGLHPLSAYCSVKVPSASEIFTLQRKRLLIFLLYRKFFLRN